MTTEVTAPTRAWPRVKWTRAAQVAPLLGDAAEVSDVAAMTPAAAFVALRAADPMAATRFVAQCLPRVDAARWVAACIGETGPDPLPPARAAAVKAVRRWVGNPSDEARRLAMQAGTAAGFDTSEGMACLAIFLSGGSLAPPEQEVPVNPPPGAFGQAAAGAVLLAASADGVPAFAGRIAAMLDRADAIAAGDTAQ